MTGLPPTGASDPATAAERDAAAAADSGAGADSSAVRGGRALRDAVVEMTHAQGDGVTTRVEGASVVVSRRTAFLRIDPRADGGLDLHFRYPSGAPDDARLRPTADGGCLVQVTPSDMDADLLALEPLIEAAYAQNG